jgi:hypothetical protein
VTDEPTIDAEPRVDDLRKENARLTRRVARVEATLREVEQIRDTNARLLDRIRGELDAERRRSHDLLLNVLPQSIIDRLGAGEGTIADRHEDVADLQRLRRVHRDLVTAPGRDRGLSPEHDVLGL